MNLSLGLAWETLYCEEWGQTLIEALQLKNISESDLPLLHQWFNDPVAAGDYDGIPGNSLENLTKKFTSGRLKGMRLVEYLGKKIGWTEICGGVDPRSECAGTEDFGTFALRAASGRGSTLQY